MSDFGRLRSYDRFLIPVHALVWTASISWGFRVPHTRMWRTLHADGMYPYHVQRVQHLRPGDFAERLNFCKWLNGRRQLHRYIMFTDEVQFNRDVVNNTHNSHAWADENPHATVESNFQQRFSVNVWCAVPTCYLRGSQPSGSLCCGRRWHFRKSALSTDKFKFR